MQKDTSSYISTDHAGTLDGLFRERVRLSTEQTAFTYYDREQKKWIDLSWLDMANLVSRWQSAFDATALEKGDRIAICLKNSPEWVIADQSALAQGLIVVPLYIEDRPDNVAYVIQDSGSRLLIIQSAKHWGNLVSTAPDALKGVEHVIVVEGEVSHKNNDSPKVWTLSDWMAHLPNPLKERGGDPNDLATIVYTSGTTGKPKGVMLSHKNILSVAEGSGKAVGLRSDQTLLSFLPLSHTFERTCGYYTPMMWGMHITYARSIQTLADDLLQVKPNVLVSVPRIFERVYERIQGQLAESSAIKRKIFRSAVNVGWRNFKAEQKMGRRGPSHIFWPFLKKKVANTLLSKLGGNLELAISGGAALPQPVAKLFLSMGLNLIQGYGMTESSPVVCANRPDCNDPESVGHPFDNIQVRIGDNDELQVNSPGIMLGYWNNHKATNEVMMEDGWLRTGDKARIDNGMVYITGRIKDILIMSNGEKIPPVDMEDAIKLEPIFENVIIVGESKAYLSAVIVLDSEKWVGLAKEHQLDPFDQSALTNNKLHKTVLHQIARALKDFPGYAKVRRVALTLDPWTVDNGLLTPTLKTKRQVIMNKFENEINAMYSK
ncbi:Long-chain-fatty-acid--CoA ligase [hydrothermal vent metagenome]|uniref:Long-chain-fatty-acid--CoA ligase n=1 Tax=hydrothermal vent metagenome TaxID=652676 RepID=A0A3B1B0T5_9ZZZZ